MQKVWKGDHSNGKYPATEVTVGAEKAPQLAAAHRLGSNCDSSFAGGFPFESAAAFAKGELPFSVQHGCALLSELAGKKAWRRCRCDTAEGICGDPDPFDLRCLCGLLDALSPSQRSVKDGAFALLRRHSIAGDLCCGVAE